MPLDFCPICGAPLAENATECPAGHTIAARSAPSEPVGTPAPVARENAAEVASPDPSAWRPAEPRDAPPPQWTPPPPPAWSTAPGYGQQAYAPAAAVPDDMLYPVSIRKLAVLCLCTFGIYELFWFYRNWSRIRARGRNVWPFWRMFFAPIWAFSLFEQVMDDAHAAGVEYTWHSVVLGIAFFVLSASWRFPDPWSVVSVFAFVPLVPVQLTINAVAARRGVRTDDAFAPWQIAVAVIGGFLLVLALVGVFVAPQTQ